MYIFLYKPQFEFPWDICLLAQLIGGIVKEFLAFEKLPNAFSLMAMSFHILTSSLRVIQSSEGLLNLVLLQYIFPNGSVVKNPRLPGRRHRSCAFDLDQEDPLEAGNKPTHASL